MIRVLHIVGSMNRGGIETFLMNLYRNVDRKNVQFDFAVHTRKEGSYDKEIEKLGGRIFHITPRMNNFFQHNKDWNNLFINNQEISIVHQHVTSLTYTNPLKIARKHNIKNRIIHSHNVKAESKLHFILHLINSRSIHENANIYFSCSNIATKWLFKKSKVDLNDVRIVKNAIDTNKFNFDEKNKLEFKKDMGISNDFVIGHVGRFAEQKNHKFLIDIFEKVSLNISNSKMILVGTGELEENIREYVKEKKLEEKVIFIGSSPEVVKYMNIMDAFVFPSIYEGLGIVLIEAQTNGLMCFTSQNVVPEEVKVTDLVNFISLEKSARHWANEITGKAISYQRRSRRQEIVDAKYDIKDESQKLEKIYMNLIKH